MAFQSIEIGTGDGSSSVEILPNPEEVVPPLKRRHLVSLSVVGPSIRVDVDELSFWVVDVVEPSTSEAISSDPFDCDRQAMLALKASPGTKEGEDMGTEDVPVRV